MESHRPPPRNNTPSDFRNPFASSEESDDAGSVAPITEDQRARFVLDTFQLADDAASTAESEKSSDESDDEDIMESPFAKPGLDDLRISPFAEAPKKPASNSSDKPASTKPFGWQSTTKPTGNADRPALGRTPTIASGRGGTPQPTTNTESPARRKPSREQVKAVNNSAFQNGGKTLKLVYPRFFDQKRGSKALNALNEQIDKICSSETPITTEEANALYKRFCVIELVGEFIEFMVPITTVKRDEAVQWMNSAFTSCTQEIARKIRDGASYRSKDSLEAVKKEEMQKFGKEVKVMVWNIWPHQSLLFHKSALQQAIDDEVKKQTGAKSIAIGLFRESSNAGAALVNSALVGCAHPFGTALVQSCTTWLESPTFTAVVTADQHLDDLATNRAKQELVKGLATVMKNHLLQATADFDKATRWIVRRFLDAIAASKLGDADKRTLERQVMAYIFLNAQGGYISRTAAAMPGFRQRVLIRSWGVVVSWLNAAATGSVSKKEPVAALLQASDEMAAELRKMFDALIDEIRNDPDLAGH